MLCCFACRSSDSGEYEDETIIRRGEQEEEKRREFEIRRKPQNSTVHHWRRDSSSSLSYIMGNSNLKQHIETAKKTGACQLRNLGLKEIPEDLQKLSKTLRTVDLSDNKIDHLAPWIVSFGALKNFTMNNCKLGALPDDFGQLKKLEVLTLIGNSLTRLPRSLSNLSHLKTLTLSKNRFKSFPLEILPLQQLDVVDLSQNAIAELPSDISSLQSVELNLNENQISFLPDSLSQCPRLKVLRLEENCLEASSFTPTILKSSKISLFAIEGNMFDMKTFHNLEGYDEYMERYTATKRKFN